MNPYSIQNIPMMVPSNFYQNLNGMNYFNPFLNMNPFGQFAQFNILNQNMDMPNIQGGNSKPKSEPITLFFKKKNKQKIFTIETSSDERMASVVNKYIEKSGDDNVNRYFYNGKIISQVFTIKESGLKNNDLIEVVRLTKSELEAL